MDFSIAMGANSSPSSRRLEILSKRLPAPANRLHRSLREQRIREETVDKVKEEGFDGKVFGIGLSRTATTSLAAALEELGYTAAHWKIRRKITGIEEFYRFDAVTDTPCACRFEQLYYAFPDSKFIYTTRDVSEWIESVRTHFGCDDPRQLTSTELVTNRAENIEDREGWRYENLLQWLYIHQSLYSRHGTWREAYEKHDERVRSFFEGREDRFMEINIIESNTPWQRMCVFLDREVPERAFPHEIT